jgi:DnaJ-class molecular chaperone
VSALDPLTEIRLIVEELHAGLDKLPYHVFLGVPEGTEGDGVRAAFHTRARVFHPDLFVGLGDDDLRARVYDVYKRMTEAYRVLGDPQLRKQYDEQRRAGRNRLEQAPAARPAPKRPEDAIANAAARKYYLLALEGERRGDTQAMKMNLKLALQMEPDNEVIKAKLEGS